ncbi:MAG: hypothetical protein EOO61_11515 [Hymenobacter sp.]|nr:MAG: hypothetical protein EOO61_11515 [Hymenobacter sp.]
MITFRAEQAEERRNQNKVAWGNYLAMYWKCLLAALANNEQRTLQQKTVACKSLFKMRIVKTITYKRLG